MGQGKIDLMLQNHLIILTISSLFLVYSCDTLLFTEQNRDILIISRYHSVVPNDSMVTFPQVSLTDTLLYNAFDEIIDYNNIYLSHAKKGEKSWFEVSSTMSGDTTVLDIYARQYDDTEGAIQSQNYGVINYKDNFFLIHMNTVAQSQIIRPSTDSLTFNSIFRGTTVYYILNDNYNYPEFIHMKYNYINGNLVKTLVEINDYFLENGILYKKEFNNRDR